MHVFLQHVTELDTNQTIERVIQGWTKSHQNHDCWWLFLPKPTPRCALEYMGGGKGMRQWREIETAYVEFEQL
jgi:hypothetical protein